MVALLQVELPGRPAGVDPDRLVVGALERPAARQIGIEVVVAVELAAELEDIAGVRIGLGVGAFLMIEDVAEARPTD